MALISGVLELLNTTILSIVHGTFKIGKATLTEIQTYLQNAQDKIKVL